MSFTSEQVKRPGTGWAMGIAHPIGSAIFTMGMFLYVRFCTHALKDRSYSWPRSFVAWSWPCYDPLTAEGCSCDTHNLSGRGDLAVLRAQASEYGVDVRPGITARELDWQY